MTVPIQRLKFAVAITRDVFECQINSALLARLLVSCQCPGPVIWSRGFVTLTLSVLTWPLIAGRCSSCALGHDDGDACNERQWWRKNRGNTTTSWRTRGKLEGRCQWTRGGKASRGQEAAATQREASRQPAGVASGHKEVSSWNRCCLETMRGRGYVAQGWEKDVVRHEDKRGKADAEAEVEPQARWQPVRDMRSNLSCR